ncbi:ABC transporter permease [Falsirhodobacter algicola]|uniref:ABC transporter permease subunit n=1 Tax=Falsirhodobacter algicola TaxID=2692330 RepID=A0A8J8MTN0_9RHOB|nr:ABC transporter permease [Falsirhodobacter algicola]QUS36244.1 ABC transporter permease subunit [Falsirhodobacter algicola]
MRRLPLILLAAAILVFLLRPALFVPLLAPLGPPGAPVIYDRASLAALTLSHLALVAAAMVPATLVAVTLGILVQRPAGAAFLPLSRALAGFGQTFPPVAVLALTVPVLGFGMGPTVLALFLYALLPVFENTLTALSTLPPPVIEAARGMGLTPRQRLWRVELPLALPLILEGVRTATVISLSTATIGSVVAARGLGEVIVAGLTSQNTAFIAQGGILVAALAILISGLFTRLAAALRG